MPELRWILIVCGVVLLLGIYLWGRRGASKEAIGDEARLRPEPQLREAPGLGSDFDAEPGANFSADEAALEPSEDEVDDLSAKPIVDQFAATAMRPATYRAEMTPRSPAQLPSIRMDRLDSDTESGARRGRIEPTFGEDHAETAELPVHDDDMPTEEVHPARDAPTLGMSSTPAPRRIERRKIMALRLASGTQRFDGAQLRETLEAEELQHGRYDVYHRLHDDGSSIFSVASMVEPGTFDRDKMPSTNYPGITLFAQLPGPTPGVVALNELVACGRRLQEVLGGTLQDERGVPLTAHRIERLRQEIRDFEHSPARDTGPRGASVTTPAP
jgi:cell division protein ZipA